MKQPKLTQLLPILTACLLLGLPALLMGQEVPEEPVEETTEAPAAVAEEPDLRPDLLDDDGDNLPADMPSRFDLVFNRGFALPGPARDTVPLSSTASGTYFIGGGFKFPFGRKNVVGLRATPGVAWTHLSYQQTADKTFPTIPDSVGVDYTTEKHRLFFLEMPLSLYVNLSRDEDGDPMLFLEAGGYVGYLAGAMYRVKYRNSAGQRVMERTRDLEQISEPEGEFERLRYGIFTRFGYKWFSLYYSMRLTPVFDEFTNPALNPRGSEGFRNPTIPEMELGLSLFL